MAIFLLKTKYRHGSLGVQCLEKSTVIKGEPKIILCGNIPFPSTFIAQRLLISRYKCYKRTASWFGVTK